MSLNFIFNNHKLWSARCWKFVDALVLILVIAFQGVTRIAIFVECNISVVFATNEPTLFSFSVPIKCWLIFGDNFLLISFCCENWAFVTSLRWLGFWVVTRKLMPCFGQYRLGFWETYLAFFCGTKYDPVFDSVGHCSVTSSSAEIWTLISRSACFHIWHASS